MNKKWGLEMMFALYFIIVELESAPVYPTRMPLPKAV